MTNLPTDPRTGLHPGVREDEIKMMSHPELWPNMVLPLKRGKGFPYDIGILSGIFGFETTVFGINIFEIGKLAPAVEAIRMNITPDILYTKYDSYEAICDDGWMVD